MTIVPEVLSQFSLGNFGVRGSMKVIKLSGNAEAMVDDEDFDFINTWKWGYQKDGRTGYARRSRYVDVNIKSSSLLMHRVILGLKRGDHTEVDHIDGNGLNNQKNNLRLTTHLQNMHNNILPSNNKSGHKGVMWHKASKKWAALIGFNNKKYHLGVFSDKSEAIKAYDEAEIKFFGEFRRLNP